MQAQKATIPLFLHIPYLVGYAILALLILFLISQLRNRFLLARQEHLQQLVQKHLQELEKAVIQGAKLQYTFIDVDEEYKSLVVDALNGFSDYAKLKGYEVRLIINTNYSGKVGFKFETIKLGTFDLSSGVQRDVDEYINHLRSSDDLSNLPMLTDTVQHSRLVAALQTRFSYLRIQVNMLAIQSDFYKCIAEGWSGSPHRGFSIVPAISLNVTNIGEGNMRDSYSIKNSQNVAQGKGAKAITEGSSVHVGKTYSEKFKQIESLSDFEAAVDESSLPRDAKESVLNQLRNVREEITESASPNPTEIGNGLGQVYVALNAAGAASGLIDKFNQVLGLLV